MTKQCIEALTSTDFVFTTSDGCKIAYRFDGAADKPVLVLSNSIGTTLHMWDLQISALSQHFHILRYDTRGHGGSDTPTGDYSMERLGQDVLELLDNLKLSRVHFCGLSLGGMIGQWLGIHAPERIERLILCNTSAFLGPTAQWDERIADVLKAAPSETAEMFLHNWFPSNLLNKEEVLIAPIREVLLAMNPQGFAGCYAAVRDMDFRTVVSKIQSPVLVIAGQYDTVTLPEHGELLAENIPGATLMMLPAVHLSNIEYPDAFLDVTLKFLIR